MEITKTKKSQLGEKAPGVFLLGHPVPVLFYIIAVTIFTLLEARAHPIWGTIVLVIAAHAAMQISIAMLNDYCDRRLDAESKPDRPVPQGAISPYAALIGSLVMIAVMLVLLLPLPPLALLISLAYLALGQAYNLGLKSTPFSGGVFALAMPLIPLYAFAGVGRPPPFLFWLVPVGFFLGVVLNLAKSLPDVEKDTAHGKRTLAVVLGVKRSFIACQLLIVVSATLIGILIVLRIVSAHPWIIVITLILTCLAIEAMLLFFGPEKPVETRKLYFYLVSLTCIILAGGWFIGVLI